MAFCRYDRRRAPFLCRRFPCRDDDEWRRLVDAALKGAPFARLESKTYDGLTIEPLYDRAAAARAVTGRAPGTAWTLMQRVDHPDPATANAQARDDLENGATGLVLVFAGSVSANGFGLAASPAIARARARRHRFAGVAIDLNLSVRRRGMWFAISRRWSKAAAWRRPPSICALASIRSAVLPRPARARAAGTSSQNPLPRRSASLPAPVSADRLPSPTDASSTMLAARTRRSLPSRWRARWPICARWKLAASRSKRRAMRFISGSRQTPISS